MRDNIKVPQLVGSLTIRKRMDALNAEAARAYWWGDMLAYLALLMAVGAVVVWGW